VADEPQAQFNEQTFLLDFWDKTIRNTGFPYENFIQLEGRSAAVMNSLLLKGNSNVLKNLTPAQMALLVPKVAIYKVLQDPKTRKRTQKRFEFDDFTSVASLTEETGRGRGLDAALISFTWKDMGTDQSNSGLSFEASLKLKFSNFDGIFHTRPNGLKFADLLMPPNLTRGKDKKLQKADVARILSGGERRIDPTELAIKAVVGWNTPSDPGGVLFKKDKTKFGGRDPLTLFRETQVAFLLTLTKNDINIGEAGNIELTLTYQAAIEGQQMTSRADLLRIDFSSIESEYQQNKATLTKTKADYVKSAKKLSNKNFASRLYEKMRKKKFTGWNRLEGDELKVYKASLRKFGDLPGEGTTWQKTGLKGNKARVIEIMEWAIRGPLGTAIDHGKSSTQKELDYQKKKLKLAKQDLRTEAYSRLLCQIDKGFDRLYNIVLSPEQVEYYINEVAEPGDSFKEMKEAVLDRGGFSKKKVTADADQSAANEARSQAEKHDAPQEKGVLDKAKDLLGITGGNARAFAQEAQAKLEQAANGDPNYILTFFYFGDLVEAALEILKTNNATKDIKSQVPLTDGDEMKFLLGTVDIYDPTSNETHSIPLCDVPISLSLFRNWFYKTIIKSDTTRLYLLTFLKQVSTKLIVGALREMKKYESAKDLNIKLSASSLLMSKKRLTQGSKEVKGKAINVRGRVPINKLRSSGYGSIAYADVSSLEQYYFLYIGGTLNQSLKGKKGEDEKRGIPHLFIGRDRGMVKRINFKRTDLPFQRQIKVANEIDRAKGNFLFCDHYSAEVTMVGNALFKPGMLLFINPQALGSEMTVAPTQPQIVNSRASQLGIGGYYMVKEVNNVIESGKFETTLDVIGTLPLYSIGAVKEPQTAKPETPAAQKERAARAVEDGTMTVEEANAILSLGGVK